MSKPIGVNQNYLHELNICNSILERERNMLENHRILITMYERSIKLDMERIIMLRRRIYELESHGHDRTA